MAKIQICLGEVLAKRRKKMADLSREIGVSKNTLSKWWHGDTTSVDLEILAKICVALKCMPGDLLKLEDDDKNLSSNP